MKPPSALTLRRPACFIEVANRCLRQHPGSPDLQGYAAQRWFNPSALRVRQRARSPYPFGDGCCFYSPTPARRPPFPDGHQPCLHLLGSFSRLALKSAHARLCAPHRDGRETPLASPCPTRHSALPLNDNPADNSWFATPRHLPPAPTLRCSEHLSDPQAGRWCDCRAAPAQPRAPASSAGAAFPRRCPRAVQEAGSLGSCPCSGSYRAVCPALEDIPTGAGALPP